MKVICSVCGKMVESKDGVHPKRHMKPSFAMIVWCNGDKQIGVPILTQSDLFQKRNLS